MAMYTILRGSTFDRWLGRLRERRAVNRIVAKLLAAQDDTYPAGHENGDTMEEPMTEQYREFDAADYIRTKDDVRGLLRAAVDEGLWGRGRDPCRIEARRTDPRT